MFSFFKFFVVQFPKLFSGADSSAAIPCLRRWSILEKVRRMKEEKNVEQQSLLFAFGRERFLFYNIATNFSPQRIFDIRGTIPTTTLVAIII